MCPGSPVLRDALKTRVRQNLKSAVKKMTANKAPQAAASEKQLAWTTTAVRNFHITVFAISAILGAYLVYASSFPPPKDGEPAPLWPYEGVLLAFLLVGATVNISLYMDKHKMESPLVWLLACDVVLSLLHFFVWVGYGSAYSWGSRKCMNTQVFGFATLLWARLSIR
ncbi:hypothetical protein LTR17_004705 [Elasticomyces elasticus]|nr:hypothetical protein LTR17_004705 [Elasticomyces elasticus]